MDTEESRVAKNLLAGDLTISEQKASILRISEILEEGYILNLPASRDTLAALDAFSSSTHAAPALKAKAQRIFKKYKI